MKKIIYLFSAILLLFTFSSCDEQFEVQNPESIDSQITVNKNSQIKLTPTTLTKSQIMDMSCGEPTIMTLYAGQYMDVGTVTVSNDENNLYVTYEVTGEWWLNETHLYVGCEGTTPPLNKSENPVIGDFPFHGEHGNVKNYSFEIPLSEFDCATDCFVISTHATVVKLDNEENIIQDETAFGCGDDSTPFPGKRWGCYFDYCLEDCEDDCIDAFGRKNSEPFRTCLSMNIDGNNKWGWSNKLPYYFLNTYPDYGLEIYSNIGDGDCDITGNNYLGFVVITPADNGAEINIQYMLNTNSQYEISEVNLYVGPKENPFEDDGITFKENIDGSNFYKEEFDIPVMNTDLITMAWSGDLFIIPYLKLCKKVE